MHASGSKRKSRAADPLEASGFHGRICLPSYFLCIIVHNARMRGPRQDLCADCPIESAGCCRCVRLMKIPRARQDAHIARMADFLCRVIWMVAPIVVERLDQRGACRHGIFA